jgi:flagellar biosynthesis chaperone FliJ
MTKEMQEVMQEREELYERIRKLTGMKKEKMEELKGLVQRASWVTANQQKNLLNNIIDNIIVGVPLDKIFEMLKSKAGREE